jgi:hypothetical protein
MTWLNRSSLWWLLAIGALLLFLIVVLLDPGGWGAFLLDFTKALLVQGGIAAVLYGILRAALTPLKSVYSVTWTRARLSGLFFLAALLGMLMLPALFGRPVDIYDGLQTLILIALFYVLAGRYRLILVRVRQQGEPPASLKEHQLFDDLLLKVGGDRATAERLIDYERTRAPGLSREEYISRAIQRWERDND